MKILFCTPVAIKQELGASRHLLGVADGLRALGWECKVVGADEVRAHDTAMSNLDISYADRLRGYLRAVAANYDVVEYPYDKLPFPRSDFPKGPLFVARSVLLDYHFIGLKIPEVILLRQRFKRWITGGKCRQRLVLESVLANARSTMDNADLVNVSNEDDRRALIQQGIAPHKIVVIPCGLSAGEFLALGEVNQTLPTTPRLCFLGTFDHRKGGADLPGLFAAVHAKVPGCQLRLLGTAGLHQTAERVRSFFPRHLRDSVEVVPRFGREGLAGLLEGCSVGVFPSYVEGFGFGVLEMMAAGMPVVAYRSPGPPMMLTDDFLVPRGDVDALARRVLRWLQDANQRQQAAEWCRHRAQDFSWQKVGVATDAFYRRQ